MPRPIFSIACRSLALACATPLAGAEPAAPIDFNRDVRPILSDNCFKCHGFDPGTRKADRRLDTRDGALADIDGVRAIVPGQLPASDLSERIHSTEKDEQMPPPKSGKKLTPQQIAMLDKWIEQGAPYAVHWAFVKPVHTPPPQSGNPIDAFIHARLEKENLPRSAEADKYTLVRRVSLDLIGLPPTPEETDTFVQDPSPDAYEKLVDRLLASPRYGERWARRWLDLARYADTNGYEKDRERSIWPYRDWVINALNAGMPFDQFTIEQIAGDLLAAQREAGKPEAMNGTFLSSWLPAAPRDQRIATGFHRNTMLNEEGGIDPLEDRFLAMVDRVGTTGATWLGLTVQCAQCHTHKYDPITHHEYFQFMACLDNADEPDLDLPAPDAAAQEKARAEKLAKRLAELPDKWPAGEAEPGDARPAEERRRAVLEERLNAWLARERARNVTWTPLKPVAAKSNSPLLTVQNDASIFASGDTTKTDTYDLTFAHIPRGITALRLEVLPDDRLPGHGPGMAYYEGPKGDFFLGELQLAADGQPVKLARASHSFAGNAMGGNNPVSAALAIDGDAQTGWSTNGRQGLADEAVFVPAAPLAQPGTLALKLIFGRHYACSLGRFRISVTTDPRAAEAREIPAHIEQLLLLADAQLTPPQRARLREHFLLTAPGLAAARKEIDALRKPLKHPTTLIMRERPPENPRATFLRHRGEWLQPKERVEPGVLSVLGPLAPDAPRNRLGFARWLVSPENPLTARVIMNRDWSAFFGRGLVPTIGDFGFQGAAPSHPELLDWLALEFVKRGWSVKQMHRLILTSATYRQTSAATPDRLARDPGNQLLARGPRFRLEAEVIRDSALLASGLLVEKIGGPSVRPPQPEGVTETAYGSPKWTPSTGPDRYRRSLYTFAKRTAPFALYNTFDAPTGEACIAHRDVSNTPLQALALLNDIVFLEAAQALGKQLAAQPGTVEDRIRTATRRLLTRPPTDAETTLLATFFAAQKARFTTGDLDPKTLAPEGPGDPADRAAWTALARALFNLDEAVTRS